MIAPSALNTQSDSDSDWDDDDDFGAKKINIRIKPIAQVTPSKISASVDELRATVGTWKSLVNINMVKPNSRRHHQSNVTTKLPVAFAIQECLNAKLLKSTDGNSLTNLIGRLKMAVPSNINNINPLCLEDNLEIRLVASIAWNQIRLNSEFVHELNDHSQPFVPSDSIKELSIDMKAIQAYIKKQYQKQPNAKYFILPELLKYAIGSQDRIEPSNLTAPVSLNPLHALSHWLCDLNTTKVRVDIQFLKETLDVFGLSTDDIRNLDISMHINGDVVSYQSKPDANWNPLISKLSWSFTDLTELVEKSTINGVTSCLARFDLNNGPSTPNDVSLQFSIAGKTISGAHVILNNTNNFRLARQKYEVRTGTFKCETPSLYSTPNLFK